VTAVRVVVPEGIDDTMRPSGGNVYDRKVSDGLAALGWSVHELSAPGDWPAADSAAHANVGALLGDVPDGEVVLLDGLLASTIPDVIVPEVDRLPLVVVVHMPLGDTSPQVADRERAVLSNVAAVVTTSQWTKRWLLDRHGLSSDRVHVVEPGAEFSDLAPGTPNGGSLLCVGAVRPAKGHDVLVTALATLQDLPWHCSCIGAVDLDAQFVEHIRSQAVEMGIADRLSFPGPLKAIDLDSAYDGADILVSASRAETYGMVVTEALAHGLPVVATSVGGVPEALHGVGGTTRPGVLVAPNDPFALATALRRWLADRDQRERLRNAARARRLELHDWSDTSRRLAGVLAGVAS
jgi:glycosyltransferase involved in cell wall biosynthesis